MTITLKHDIGSKVWFHPFCDKTKMLQVTISKATVVANDKRTSVTYEAEDKTGTTWIVSEDSIINI